MEEKVRSESARVEVARKENNDQLRSTKAEVKSLLDKIERSGKPALFSDKSPIFCVG